MIAVNQLVFEIFLAISLDLKVVQQVPTILSKHTVGFATHH